LENANQWIMILVAIALSLFISILVALLSGSLQRRNMRADAPLDEFKAHMNDPRPSRFCTICTHPSVFLYFFVTYLLYHNINKKAGALSKTPATGKERIYFIKQPPDRPVGGLFRYSGFRISRLRTP
jgi:hypothetical protein